MGGPCQVCILPCEALSGAVAVLCARSLFLLLSCYLIVEECISPTRRNYRKLLKHPKQTNPQQNKTKEPNQSTKPQTNHKTKTAQNPNHSALTQPCQYSCWNAERMPRGLQEWPSCIWEWAKTHRDTEVWLRGGCPQRCKSTDSWFGHFYIFGSLSSPCWYYIK